MIQSGFYEYVKVEQLVHHRQFCDPEWDELEVAQMLRLPSGRRVIENANYDNGIKLVIRLEDLNFKLNEKHLFDNYEVVNSHGKLVYRCKELYCRKEFRSAQAVGGHMGKMHPQLASNNKAKKRKVLIRKELSSQLAVIDIIEKVKRSKPHKVRSDLSD